MLTFGFLLAVAVVGWLMAFANAAPTSAPASTDIVSFATAPVTRLTDFNRDGFTDLVARDAAGRLWLYPGNGGGGFRPRHLISAGWSGMTTIVSPGDVTGDGRSDLIACGTPGRLWLYPGDGTGGLSARRQIGSGCHGYLASAANPKSAGRPDLLLPDSSGHLWLYPLSGNAVFGARRQIGAGSRWSQPTILAAVDMSGDQRADLITRDSTGTLRLFRGNGTGGFDEGRVVSRAWHGLDLIAAPGNWDRALGNDLLARDGDGRLWLYPGDNAGGLGPRRQVGNGWGRMNDIS